jgi:predicted ATPase/DNA-binding SARP family transcriptional activator
MSARDTLTYDAPASPNPPHPLEMRLFGPMEVRVGGELLPRLRSRKGLWLLALLALRGGRGVERDWVAGTLWPDSDEADARRSLRQSLHDLRAALGPEAERLGSDEPRTLRLDVAGAAVDALAFDAAIGHGDLAALEAAVRLYRGPLLEDCAEEWGLEERRRREQEYVTALETLAAAAAAQKEYAAAAGYLRPIVGIDPYREDSQRALMHALAGGGNPAGALLVYRQFRELLRREMATEPADETTALFRRLRAEARERSAPRVPAPPLPASALLSPIPRSLPLVLTPLIGRNDAVREVVTRLAHAPLVTLTGAGGIGKTRLALGVAEELADEYADGARFVSLAPLSDPETVPDAVLTALGTVRGESPEAAVEFLKEFLASRRLLLVLDNCEHLLDACAALADALLCHCPGLRLLATSRQALGLRGETVWRVPSLALPPAAAEWPGGLGPSDYAAVRLFVERAQAAESGFALTPHNTTAVAAICRRLDGIPLALELAAARVRSLSVEDISARLSDGFGLLTGGGRTLLPRQQTLAATFDWGWDLLSDAERTLLSRLSVFAGGWGLEAAEAVCPDGGALRADDVVDLLTALVDKSLVVYRPAVEGSAPRYFLLETVRQYAGERLRENDGDDATRDRHRGFFLALAEQARLKLTGPEQSLWLGRLETEHDNLRAALHRCERGPEMEAGLRLAQALWRFWYMRGYLSEGRQWLERMLARDTGAESAARTKALNAAGNLAQIQGDYGPARAFYEECLAIQRRLGDEIEIGNACNNLGNMVSDQGDYAGARALYTESLEISRRAGKRQGIANALSNLGQMAYEQGDYAGARPLWEESLTLERQLGNPAGIAASLGSLGMLADSEGDRDSAWSYLQECLALYRELGDQPGMSHALTNLGNVACRRGDFAAAEPLYVESLVIGRRLGNLPKIAHGLEGLAAVAGGRGQALRAARVLGAAQALREATGCPLPPAGQREHEAQSAALREVTGGTEFDAAFAVGRAMTWEQAFQYAQD